MSELDRPTIIPPESDLQIVRRLERQARLNVDTLDLHDDGAGYHDFAREEREERVNNLIVLACFVLGCACSVLVAVMLWSLALLW